MGRSIAKVGEGGDMHILMSFGFFGFLGVFFEGGKVQVDKYILIMTVAAIGLCCLFGGKGRGGCVYSVVYIC